MLVHQIDFEQRRRADERAVRHEPDRRQRVLNEEPRRHQGAAVLDRYRMAVHDVPSAYTLGSEQRKQLVDGIVAQQLQPRPRADQRLAGRPITVSIRRPHDLPQMREQLSAAAGAEPPPHPRDARPFAEMNSRSPICSVGEPVQHQRRAPRSRPERPSSVSSGCRQRADGRASGRWTARRGA
jgi:hypothetical protein